ncbi:transmembrane protease serine 9-like [Anopheles darlingi]|uniref:transmembrane protease serine 9-like n=1 Tax=Anopheles darlingi TaxID=43151 RepID=UPI00210045DC|nr:transmembrane protease serine 9-like [Anopheles darlingi]
MEHRVRDLAFWLVFVLNVVVSGQTVSLFGDAPRDYNERTNMKDCPTRFYSKPHPKGNGEIQPPSKPQPMGKIAEPTATTQVFGGVQAFADDFTHMAAIGWTRSSGKIDYLCGGSLITEVFILTAAHCNSDFENNAPDTVRIGDADFNSSVNDFLAQQIGIRRIIEHPQYRGSRSYFDIALIELVEPAIFNAAVCPACLWREPDLPTERMDAIGFGVTGFGEDLSPTLQRALLEKIDLNNCSERIAHQRSIPDGLRDDQFCAAGNNMDTCEGDSGGSIGVKRPDVRGNVISLIAGVVSFGTPCGVGSTGVYTRIGAYIDWLEQETNRSLSYAVCTQSFKCPKRKMQEVPLKFDPYPIYRFGLLWNEEDTSVFECGATLIDYQFLLTSAQCVTSRKGYPKFIGFKSDELPERIGVTDVYVSPKYKPDRPENDIALVKVENVLNTDYFRPACLWDRRVDGDWGVPRFRAFGSSIYNNTMLFTHDTIEIFHSSMDALKTTNYPNTDLVSFDQSINLMPGVCSIDYGASAISGTNWNTPIFTYGVMSILSRNCTSNLYVNDITPHIDWIEAIVVKGRDQAHVFSD